MNREEAQQNIDISKMHLPKPFIFYSVFLCLIIITPAYCKCPPSYSCRNFTLEFPFTVSNDPGCGLFVVNGCNASVSSNLTVSIGGSSGEPSTYAILGKVSRNKLLIRDLGLHAALSNRTCYSFSNMSLPRSPSVSFTFSPNLTFFTCYKAYAKDGLGKSSPNYNKTNCGISTVYYKTPAANTRVDAAGDTSVIIPPGCVVTQLPLKSENSSGELFDMLSADFRLEWSVSEACNECYHGGGQCLADNENRFYCRKGTIDTLEIILYPFGGLDGYFVIEDLVRVFFRRKRPMAVPCPLVVSPTSSFYVDQNA